MSPEIDSYVEDNLICIKCTITLHSILGGWEWSCQAMVLKQIDTHMEKRNVLTSTVYYTKKKNSNWTICLKVMLIKLLEENIRTYIIILRKMEQNIKVRICRLDFIKIKQFDEQKTLLGKQIHKAQIGRWETEIWQMI